MAAKKDTNTVEEDLKTMLADFLAVETKEAISQIKAEAQEHTFKWQEALGFVMDFVHLNKEGRKMITDYAEFLLQKEEYQDF